MGNHIILTKKSLVRLCLILLWAGIFSGSSSALSDTTYVVSIAPSHPSPIHRFEESTDNLMQSKVINTASALSMLPTKEQAWQAVFDYLESETGIKLKLEPASSQLDFELNLAKGHYDFAYANPLQFLAFSEFPGYQSVVKRKAQPIKGIIVVKKRGSTDSLTKLRNATIAFPGMLDYPASVVLRDSLKRLKVDIKPQFLASQKDVYSAVVSGEHIAGGGSQESFDALSSEIQNALRIVWTSPGYTPYAFIAHPRIPFFTIIQLQRAMIGLTKNEKGRVLLPDIFVDNGFEVARDSDWHDAQLIDLEELNGPSGEIQQ